MTWITTIFLAFWQIQAARVWGIPPDVFYAKYKIVNHLTMQYGFKFQRWLLNRA